MVMTSPFPRFIDQHLMKLKPLSIRSDKTSGTLLQVEIRGMRTFVSLSRFEIPFWPTPRPMVADAARARLARGRAVF
jgi:hypothetical protein